MQRIRRDDEQLDLLYLPEYPFQRQLSEIRDGRRPWNPYTYFVKNVAKHGIRVDVISVGPTGPFGLRMSYKMRGFLQAMRALPVLSRYDVVLAWRGPVIAILAARILLRWKRPRIAVIAWRPFDTKSGGVSGFLKRLLAKVTFSMADKVIVVSSYQIEEFSRELNLGKDRFEFVPYGVDCEFFSSSNGKGADPFLLMTGNVDRDDEMMFAAIRDKGTEIKRVTTFPSVVKHVRECAEKYGIENLELLQGITYTELKALLEKSSLVVLPIKRTNHPAGLTSLLEAMAMGKPIIATRGLSTMDYVTEGETGVLLESGDVTAWKRSVSELLHNPCEANRLGLGARRKAEEEFSLEVIADRLAQAMWDMSD